MGFEVEWHQGSISCIPDSQVVLLSTGPARSKSGYSDFGTRDQHPLGRDRRYVIHSLDASETSNKSIGLCFVQDDNDNTSVQIAYHLGSGTDRITSLALPFTANSAVGSSTWQHDLLRGQRRFSDEYNLAGNVMARAYGLCTSPFGDMVAVNASFHPSDGVEYTTSSDEVSYLITSQCNDDLQFALAGSPSNPYGMSKSSLTYWLY